MRYSAVGCEFSVNASVLSINNMCFNGNTQNKVIYLLVDKNVIRDFQELSAVFLLGVMALYL